MTSKQGAQARAGGGWRLALAAGVALLAVGVGSFLLVAAGLDGNNLRSASKAPSGIEADAKEAPLPRAEIPALELLELGKGPDSTTRAAAEIDAQRDPLAEHLYLSGLALGLRSAPGRFELPRSPHLQETLVEVRAGDTLMALLRRAGAGRKEAHEAVEALSAEYDPRHLRPGQEIQLALSGPEAGALSVEWLRLVPDAELEVHVQREEEGYAALTVERPLARQEEHRQGEISSSLFAAGNAAEVPHGILVEAIRAMSFDVDFQRDIQPGTSFEFFYEVLTDEGGEVVKDGDLHYVALGLGERDRAYYRFESEEGISDFYDANGLSARRGLLRTPIDGARISSNFGMRRHPIKGYNRMHRGIDFAAPTGTPIYAGGDGTVEMAGRNGGYGNYIRIRHGNGYQTAYAHLSRFAQGISAGTRVRQGQVIGYVGSTGASTGPHLHYEVLVDGKQVNPASIKLPTGQQLAGAEMERFQQWVAEVDRKRREQRQIQLASTRPEQAGNCKAKAAESAAC